MQGDCSSYHSDNLTPYSFCLTLQPILLNVLKDPVPRPVYDYILRSPLIESFFDNLQDRQLLRNLCRTGHKPSYSQPDDGGLAQVHIMFLLSFIMNVDPEILNCCSPLKALLLAWSGWVAKSVCALCLCCQYRTYRIMIYIVNLSWERLEASPLL